MGGGGKGGGDGGGNTVNPAAQTQAKLAKQIFQEATPLRLSLLNSIMSEFGLAPLTAESLKAAGVKLPKDFVVPGSTPGLFAATPTERAQIESQFGTAKENLVNTIAGRGSSFDRAVGNIETGRALNMADLIGGAKRRALGLAQGFTLGQTQTALGGLGSAAGNFFGPRQQGADKGGLGAGLGQLFGGFIPAKP